MGREERISRPLFCVFLLSFIFLLLASPAVGLNQGWPSWLKLRGGQAEQIGSARRVLSLFAKLKAPPQQEMHGKRERLEDDEDGPDARRLKAGGKDDDPDSPDFGKDERDTDEEESEDGSDADDSDADEEEEFTLDEFGRVPAGILPHAPQYPDLNYDYRCFLSFLDPSAEDLEKLKADCRSTFTARTTRKGEKYSAGETYWLAANDEPRCALEKLAKDVFDLHTKGKVAGVDYSAATSGAEWWTLELQPDDDVGLHWDRDYQMEADADILVHPHLSTVTYLTNAGGPTVVFGRVSPMESSALTDVLGPINEAFISRPAIGKHISFDGRLLHGAPADANIWKQQQLPTRSDTSTLTRITFLVNVWLNHVPSSAEPLPADRLARLSSTSLGLRTSGAEVLESNATLIDVHSSDTNKVINMHFVARTPLALRLPLPVCDLQAAGAGGEAAVSSTGVSNQGSWILKFPFPEDGSLGSAPCHISSRGTL